MFSKRRFTGAGGKHRLDKVRMGDDVSFLDVFLLLETVLWLWAVTQRDIYCLLLFSILELESLYSGNQKVREAMWAALPKEAMAGRRRYWYVNVPPLPVQAEHAYSLLP
jgi:hypothetical protein